MTTNDYMSVGVYWMARRGLAAAKQTLRSFPGSLDYAPPLKRFTRHNLPALAKASQGRVCRFAAAELP